jgi:hypothetical protein
MTDVRNQIAALITHGRQWGCPIGATADAKTLIGLGAQDIVHGREFGAVHVHFTQYASDFGSIPGAVRECGMEGIRVLVAL